MIKSISFTHYRKFRDITIDFSPSINAVAGINGTCKSSLLYLISNSCQEVKKTDPRLADQKVPKLLRDLNASVNTKIESLTKGDIQYNDPAPGTSGKLYSVSYEDGKTVDFRRHNAARGIHENKRFAIKPYYKKGSKESLPSLPIVYLGLSRLIPLGEVDDALSRKLRGCLPEDCAREFADLFKRFTHKSAVVGKTNELANVKRHLEFTTDDEHIDSNTISAGEDNLSVILMALVSLRYYVSSLVSRSFTNAVLLIDELDSTLHPTFQRKLLSILKDYSTKYGIQVVFTTQSVSVLRYMLEINGRIIYLVDNGNCVSQYENLDKFSLELQLSGRTFEETFGYQRIPIFVEDDEAKLMLETLFDHKEKTNPQFKLVRRHFYIFSAKQGAESLKRMMRDPVLAASLKGMICVLDGDHWGDSELGVSNRIITLPVANGRAASPEKMLFDYVEERFSSDSGDFWSSDYAMKEGYSREVYANEIKTSIDQMESDIRNREASGASTSGIRRDKSKQIFKANTGFFMYAYQHWLNDPGSQAPINSFFHSLHILFLKVCEFNDVPRNRWRLDE